MKVSGDKISALKFNYSQLYCELDVGGTADVYYLLQCGRVSNANNVGPNCGQWVLKRMYGTCSPKFPYEEDFQLQLISNDPAVSTAGHYSCANGLSGMPDASSSAYTLVYSEKESGSFCDDIKGVLTFNFSNDTGNPGNQPELLDMTLTVTPAS
jgi:hypothetical protein